MALSISAPYIIQVCLFKVSNLQALIFVWFGYWVLVYFAGEEND